MRTPRFNRWPAWQRWFTGRWVWLVAAGALPFAATGQVVDHQGQDWEPPADSVVGGDHLNIGTFRIRARQTVYIEKTGPDARGGWLRVVARQIHIERDALLEGTGAGFAGGPGGGGGGGADQKSPGEGGPAGPGARSTATPGTNGRVIVGGWGGHGSQGSGRYPGRGGEGGAGGGEGEIWPARPGGDGTDGGYAGRASTGATSGTTRDTLVWRGSGGGGGAGGGGGHSDQVNSGGGGGGGGGAGGAGGAAIELLASERVMLDGEIRSRGATGSPGRAGGDASSYTEDSNGFAGPGGAGGTASAQGSGQGGAGGAGAKDLAGDHEGSVSPPGAAGGRGGAGSGGGVLLHAPVISGAGRVDVLGGRLQRSNGGVVKLFACERGLQLSADQVVAGARQTGTVPGVSPLVTQPPEPVTVVPGEPACFRAEVIGADSLQWEHRGVPIPGATSPEYCLGQVRPEDAGEYRLVARNACGETQSAAALLVIRRATRLSGLVWDDLYADGRPGSRLITGRFPLLVIVLDASEGTLAPARGAPVGDLNQDGRANTVLDAEIAAIERLVQRFREEDAMGSKIRLCIMTAANPPALLELRPNLPQVDWRWVTNAGGDQDNDGLSDVSEALRKLRAGGTPNWTRAIQDASSRVDGIASRMLSVDGVFLPGITDVHERNVLVLGHRVADQPELNLGRVGAAARSRPVNLRVMAIRAEGQTDAEQQRVAAELRRLDPELLTPAFTEELLELMGTTLPRYPALQEEGVAGATVFVDANRDQQLNPGELSAPSLGGRGLEPNVDLDLESLDFGEYQLRVIVPPGPAPFPQRAPRDSRPQVVRLGADTFQLPRVEFPLVTTNLVSCFVTSIPPNSTLSFSANGGYLRYPFRVNTNAYPGCRWEAAASEPWILFPNGNTGRENGFLDLFVQANTNRDFGRSGRIYLSGAELVVLQDGGPATGAPPPLDPGNLRVTRLAATEVDLAWDTSFGATRHRLELSRRDDFSQLLPPANPANLGLDLSYRLTGLEPGTIYYVRLTAFNESEPSRVPARLSFQTARCQPDLIRLQPGRDFPHSGGLGYVEWVMPAPDCPWQVASLPPWVTVEQAASGRGSGRISFRLLPNTGPARTGLLTIHGRGFELRQAAGTVNFSPAQLRWETNGGLRMTTDAEPGRRVLLYQSGDLLDWQELGEDTVGPDGTVLIQAFGMEARRFYRLAPAP